MTDGVCTMNLTVPITAIAAAWMFMADDLNYKVIPASWSAINFRLVDFLFVAPFGLQSDGTFGLYKSNSTGPLAHRLTWVLENARRQNPNIKIIASQWYGSGANVYGYDLSVLPKTDEAVEKYAESVKSLLTSWSSICGGLDGYDIDYEDGNIQRNAPGVIELVRTKLDALSDSLGGRRFYTTVSPVVPTYLNRAAAYLDYVNMQNYGSGYGLTPESFVAMGIKPQQLLYGICPETGCSSHNITDVENQYRSNKLAGIHLWRLNSDNYKHELQVQKQIYAFMHPHQARRSQERKHVHAHVHGS